MYNVSIYDKSKKLICTYENIHTIKLLNGMREVVVTGDELLSYYFPTIEWNYQLVSDNGNYSIDSSIIGTFEVTKVC